MTVCSKDCYVRKKVSQPPSHSQRSIGAGRVKKYQAHNQYIHLGYFPIDAREVVEDMFKQYKALGGNGIVAHLKEALDALPTELSK